jgi:hydrogenase maturation protein HypF
MIERNMNTVFAGTCGRLFDAVSAICGVTKVSSYDGEAAIKLAEFANEQIIYQPYPFDLQDTEVLTIDFSKMIKEISVDVLAGQDIPTISGRFHETVVKAIVAAMVQLEKKNSEANKNVVLSGGSFHNRYLRKRIRTELSQRNFNVFVPENVPCNDGGLSYGQLVVAAAKRSANQCVLEYQQK